MAEAPKVQFNIKNCHYAMLTIADGAVSFGTPVPIPGAVTLTLTQSGEITRFYADGITYYQSSSNDGYAGSLEVAMVPTQMLKDVWGMTEGTTSKVITENANVEPKPFALLYQIDNDKGNNGIVLYNCSATRPNIGSTTNTNTKTPQTQTIDLTAAPLGNGNVKANTTNDTPAATKNAWFTSVFVEGATPPEPDPEET